MQTCYTYDKTSKRLTAAKPYGTIDGKCVINPTREQYARMTPPAYPIRTEPSPIPPEGKIAVPDGYTLDEDAWIQAWRYEDAPPSPPRVFSKLKVVSALMAIGVWDHVKNYIETNGLYDLYLAAQVFSDDNQNFLTGVSAIKTQLGWTDQQVEDILSECIVDF